MKVSKKDFIDAMSKVGVNPTSVHRYLTQECGYDITMTPVYNRIARYRQKGLLPLESGNKVQDGLDLRGTSTLYDSEGNVKIQWVKTDAKKDDQLAYFKDAIDEFVSSPRICANVLINPPTSVDSDTMSVYSIGDAHIGLLAWGAETGEDYDSTIGTADLLSAINLLVEQAHPSEEAFIIDVGDWFHADGQHNTTTAGTRVDVDSRFSKMIQTGLDLAVSLIEKALTKHSTVRWRSAIGNHDSHASIYVTSFLKAWFRANDRVIIHDTPAIFMYHQFGANLIGITHGHTAKAEKLGEIMSVDCKDLWSSTNNRYW